MRIGFDNDKYLEMQSEQIQKRIEKFGGKLYLEFGGKLFDDYHASRVLPGFLPDSKLRLLLKMKDKAEIVIVISAETIEQAKIRADLGITYDQDVFRLIDAFQAAGLYVGSVCLTHFDNSQKKAKAFEKTLEKQGIKTYRHYVIKGYPYDVDTIVSDNGLGKNEYIETTRSLVVVTAPGPGAGKMATCISQIYQDSKRGIKSGYAKFETFPVWNLPLKHPVNLAYEAATADLDDINMIDSYHLEAYQIATVNYNRDIEIYPVLRRLFEKIFTMCPYLSPTDMGVNMAGYCIVDDKVCREASRQEIIRRYLKALIDFRNEKISESTLRKIEGIMQENSISVNERKCVQPCIEKANRLGQPVSCMELEDGTLILGKNSTLLGATSAMLLNALKHLAGISDKVLLLPPSVLEPVCRLKTHELGGHNPRLHVNEILIVLSISALTNPLASLALEQLDKLKGCQSHSSVILSQVDLDTLKKLGIDHTCQAKYETKKLYHAK